MTGRVREQVAEDLHDPLRVGHRAGQVLREVDHHGVAAAAGQEGRPGAVDQRGDARGLGAHRERARLDAPGVEQVRDQAAHVVGLAVDDAQELKHLGRGRGGRGAEHGRRRALDRGQRRAELVAHHLEELRPLPLELLERRQVLHRDDERDDPALVGTDRRGVDERADAPAVGHRELDLLAPDRHGGLHVPEHGRAAEGVLAPVGEPPRHRLEEVLDRQARSADRLDDAPRLAVREDHAPPRPVEDHDTDR